MLNSVYRVVNRPGESAMKSTSRVALSVVVFATLAVVEIDSGKPLPITMIKEAQAVVGMPATPLSVAGVARRSAVRTTAVVATSAAVASTAARPAPAPAPAPAAATAFAVGTVISALPAGCANVQLKGVTYFNCQGTYFRPAYQGQNVVYIVEKP
jgi:hypothetical protein